MRILLTLLAFVLSFSLAQPAAAAKAGPLVDAAWLASRLGDRDLVALDLRSAEAYAAGHAPGARSAPYSSFGWKGPVDGVVEELPPVSTIEPLIAGLGIGPKTQVVLIAPGENAGDFGAATRVYWTFKILGHDRVSILDGGWRAWRAAGLASDTAVPAAARPGAFKARYRPELNAELGEVQAALNSGGRLVDARPAPYFRGETKSNAVKTAGAIPGAVNLEPSAFYDAGKGRFATKAELAAAAAAAGVDPKKPAIAYCNVGHNASVAWFGLSEVLGDKKVKLYDGSMAEWTADPARPLMNRSAPAKP
jgi:thiosulfate/3-mercaptopyruvate sulfurtransferase